MCVCLCLCVYVGSGYKRIELRYIHIQFVKQRINRFGLNLDNRIKISLSYSSEWIEFGSRSNLLTNLIVGTRCKGKRKNKNINYYFCEVLISGKR